MSLLLLLAIPLAPAAAQIRPGDAEEEANCARVSQMVEANSAPVLQELERLARQRFGRRFDELTPEQLIQLTRVARVEGRQETAEQERLADVLPPRLKHFLTQASYSKALDWISEQE